VGAPRIQLAAPCVEWTFHLGGRRVARRRRPARLRRFAAAGELVSRHHDLAAGIRIPSLALVRADDPPKPGPSVIRGPRQDFDTHTYLKVVFNLNSLFENLIQKHYLTV
jgi:hypothetical protein